MQNGNVETYTRQLKERKRTIRLMILDHPSLYSPVDWRRYLYGTKFDVYTDRKSLKYLVSQKQLNPNNDDGQSV